MSEPGDLSPERVAELQKQLSDAAAQVAKVQAELAAGAGGRANPSPAGRATVNGVRTAAAADGPPQSPQTVDLTAILGPEMAAQVRDQLSQLGRFGLDSSQFAGMFGDLPGHGEPRGADHGRAAGRTTSSSSAQLPALVVLLLQLVGAVLDR